MKQCIRCNMQLDDSVQSCPKCRGVQFRAVQQQINRPQTGVPQMRPNVGVNQPVQQQVRPARPVQTQQVVRPQQGYVNNQNQMNQQPYTTQPQQGNVYNQQGQYGAVNRQNTAMTQQNATTGMRLRKVSGKEKKMREMELAYAMKAAQERGEIFDPEVYKMQHGWYEEVPVNGMNGTNVNSSDMTVKDWIITLLIMLIPIVNLVIAFKGMSNINYPEYKKNYYKAFLIYYIASMALSIVLSLVINMLL